MSWIFKTLDELGKVARGKSKHRPRNDKKLFGGLYPFIQTADVKKANFYISEYSETYNETGLAQSKLWDAGTLCITIAANIAETGILSMPACFPDSIMGFIPYDGISDVRFIKYCFDILQMKCKQISQGTAQDNLSWKKLSTIKFPAPPLKTQCRIAEILSRYDTLIENYQKQIKLLEESAQRLYKEWFVDLRFPGYENTKIVDGMPEGWDNIKVGDLLCKIKKTKQVPTNCYQKTGCIPIIDQGKDYIAGFTDDNECLIKVEKIPYIVFGDHTRILKYINFSFAKGADGTQLIMSNDQKRMPQSLLYCSLINIDLSDYSYARHFKYLKEEKILLPSEGIAKKYNEMVSPIYINIKNYRNQIHKLTEARDRLLPKLMSGEIEV